MKNALVVIKHEIVTTIAKPAFWVTTFILPLIIMVFTFGSQALSMQVLEDEDLLSDSGKASATVIGYVDAGHFIQQLPDDIPPALFQAYRDENSAQIALDAGDLQSYYIIAEDYVETGTLLAVEAEYAPLGSENVTGLLEYIIHYNLLEQSAMTGLINNPIRNLSITDIQEKPSSVGEDFGTRFVVSYGVLFIFFFVLTMSSSFLMRSVSREKENRTVEVLLVSMRPRDLMLGKIIGLGVVALLQMTIWLGGSVLTLQKGDSALASMGLMLSDISFPPGFFVWAFFYFLLGYLLYAALFGAIGALAPNARETGQFALLAMLPLMLPLYLNTIFVQSPNGTLATILSLIPLTAPTSMLPRLAMGGVPLWQPLVGIVLLAVTTYLFVLLSARFFRADTLLSNASLNWKRLFQEFKNGKTASSMVEAVE